MAQTYQQSVSKRLKNHINIIEASPNANASKLSVFAEVGCAVRTMKIPTCWHFGAHGAPYHDTDFP